MKRRIRYIVSIVSILSISLLVVMNTQNQVDHNTLRIKGFYQEERESLDVILFGSSEVFTGYSPAYAYDKYGFTSYCYAIDANYNKLFKYQIDEALSCQSPKCIIIETSCYYNPKNEDEKSVSLATLRKWLDGVPISIHKKEIIDQFVDSEKLSYYFPFIMYHGLLSNYYDTAVDFSQRFRGYTYLKGITTQTQKAHYKSLMDVTNDNSSKKLSDIDDKVFKELLDYCKTLDCKVIFARFPHRITDASEYPDFMRQNYMETIASQNGFEFINYDKKFNDLNLSPYDDFYGDSHMNVNGQKKMTEYFGRYLQNEYGINPTELSSDNRSRWDKSAEYTNLFYEYYQFHENDDINYVWYETPELIKELDLLRETQ